MNSMIDNFITRFNEGWTQGQFDIIMPLLDDQIIFMAPDLQTEIKGKVSCVNTIKEYVSQAVTHLFEVTGKTIHIWDQSAVVVMDYYVEYEMNNQYYKEKGKEFWMLNRKDNQWKMIWRVMVENERVE